MKIEESAKLSAVDRFVYWIKERHQIYLRRKAGKPKPWTDDEVLQSYFFTNPYRENDKTTKWFRDNIREPLRNDPKVLFATICFRWFNFIPTGEAISSCNYGSPPLKYGLLERWDSRLALKLLGGLRDKKQQVFTGAFMINSPAGQPKLEAVCERVNNVWQTREQLIKEITGPSDRSMQWTHQCLIQFPGLGGFMAYEIVCDLRYTYLLENAPDRLTWCNPGPGAVRGLYRLLGREFKKGDNASSPPAPKDWAEQTQKLLQIVRKRLPTMPTFEMREIEMSLCEYDKYERLLNGDGKAKRKYNGHS